MTIRKMLVLSLITMVTILGLVTGCSEQNKVEDLKLGKYVMQNANPKGSSWVLLKEKSQFEFNRNIATSYWPRGSYSIKGNLLTLYVNKNESYVFTIDGDTIIFKSGEYAKNLVQNGAVFKLSDEE